MKRIISLILCVLILSVYGSTLPTAAQNITYTDASVKYALLTKIGILDDDFSDIHPEDTVTRAEFAAMAARAFGAGFRSDTVNTSFKDVTGNTDFGSEINNLYNMGIVSGSAGGYFYPDNNITVNEALSIILKLLGYVPMANARGGYPIGYQMTATSLDITANIESYDSALTMTEAAELVFGAMATDRMESTYGTEEEYKVKKDSNIFLTVYSLYYGSGIVSETEITSLTHSEGCNEDCIVVDGTIYSDPDGLGKNLLGYEADFLYTTATAGGRREIYYICATDNNSTVRINSEDIMVKDGRMYDSSDNNRRYSMDSNIYVIYNGKFYGVDFGYDWIPSYGYVTLVDNDSDGTYEVALVKNFENYVVKSVDAENDIVYTADFDTVKLKEEDTDICICYMNGMEISPTDIKGNDIISVCAAKDGKYSEVYVSSSIVKGSVEMMDNEENTALINEIWYRISPGYLEAVSAGDRQQINVSSTGEFYIDAKGGIAYFVPSKNDGPTYGYVIALAEATGFDMPQVRIFNEYGEFKNIIIPEKVKVNDDKYYTDAELTDKFKEGGKNGKANNQLVKYSVNAKGELKEISFAQENVSVENPKLLEKSYTKASRLWRPSSRSFNGTLGVSAGTLLMVVPQNESDIMNEKAYKATSLSFFANDTTYSLEAYDCSDADVAKVLVVYSDTKSVADESAVCVFVEAKKTLDAEGGDTYKICYWQRGEYKETAAESPDVLTKASFPDAPKAPAGLECGDAFRFATDSSGKISLIYKIVDVNYEKPAAGTNPSHANFNQPFRTIYGKLKALDGTNLLLEAPDGSWRENHAVHDPSKQTRYIYCDLSAPKPKKAIKSGDVSMLSRCVDSDEYRILLRTRYCYAYDLIIYKIK